MLILTRKLRERILIGDDIIVSLEQIESGQVRLGIVAPKDMPILREELTYRPRRDVRGSWGARKDRDDDGPTPHPIGGGSML